jgi:hypothetical protein
MLQRICGAYVGVLVVSRQLRGRRIQHDAWSKCVKAKKLGKHKQITD